MSDMNVLQRSEAKILGLSRYFTGKSCPAGHIADRLTSNGGCCVCSNNRTKQLYKTNEKAKETRRKHARAQYARIGTQWYHENKEHAANLNKLWRETHATIFKEYTTTWRRANLAKLAKNASAYRAQKIKATPLWANQAAIEQFYIEAQELTKRTGIKHAVDHQIPLNGTDVCGLHVETNLQVLTFSENSRKGNKT